MQASSKTFTSSNISTLASTSNSSIYLVKKGESKIVQKQIFVTKQNKKYIEMEIKLMANIDSPYVVKYLNSTMNTFNNTFSIFMRYYSNGDLSTYLLRNLGLSFKRKMRMFVDILLGLAELHSRFIIHRDLKPTNIFVDQNGRCVIGDLGIATVTQDIARTPARTPAYQAPEVNFTHSHYDEKVDIWGLGMIAFELFNPVINGRLPYAFGTPEEYVTSMRQNNSFDFVVSPLDSSVPFKLSYLIEKMLKKEPQERMSWVQLYSSEILFILSQQDQRVVPLLAKYKCLTGTKQTLAQYKKFIEQFMTAYYPKLNKWLCRRSYNANQSKKIQKHFRDLHIFFYLGMKRVLSKYHYINEKKIYKTVNDLRQKMEKVESTIRSIQDTINQWFLTEGQQQISRNKPYLGIDKISLNKLYLYCHQQKISQFILLARQFYAMISLSQLSFISKAAFLQAQLFQKHF